MTWTHVTADTTLSADNGSPRAVRLGSATEWLLSAVAVAAFIAAEILLTDSGAVITRPLWLDEIHTLLVAGLQDLPTSMRSLAAGADFNPPTLFLIYRLVGLISGGLSEVSMRLVATASVVGALVLVYRLLRDDFDRIPVALGVLAVWAQPVVTAVAFDARFYGPLLLGISALLLCLSRAIRRPTLASSILLAVLSAFVCTIHYFGIVSWGVAVTVAALQARRRRINPAPALFGAFAGPVALVACTPLYLGQRAALSVPTWIPRASVADHLFLLSVILLPPTTLAALAGWGATRLLAPLAPKHSPPATDRALGTSSTLLLSQAGVPIVLALFSLLVQPATQLRYWIAGSVAAGPIVAFAVSRTATALRVVVTLLMVATSITTVRTEGASAHDRERMVRDDVAAAQRAVSERTVIVARRRHTLYPLLRAMPAAKNWATLLDVSGMPPNASLESRLLIIDCDVARVHQRVYGFPRLATPVQLAELPSFYFLELDSSRTPSVGEFPDRAIERVAPRLYRIRLR